MRSIRAAAPGAQGRARAAARRPGDRDAAARAGAARGGRRRAKASSAATARAPLRAARRRRFVGRRRRCRATRSRRSSATSCARCIARPDGAIAWALARPHRPDDARRPRAARRRRRRSPPTSPSSSPASTTSSTRCRRGARCATAPRSPTGCSASGRRATSSSRRLPPMHRFPLLPEPLRRVMGGDARRHDAALARWAATRSDVSHAGVRASSSTPPAWRATAFIPASRSIAPAARRSRRTSRGCAAMSVVAEVSSEAGIVSAPLRWRVGDVTVTRIVESGGASSPLFASVPPTLPVLQPERRDRAVAGLAQAALRDRRGRLIASIHAFVVESRGKTIVVDTCVGNDKVRDLPAGRRLERPLPRRLRGRRLRARRRRCGAVHPPALRPRRLEHAPRRRPLGADVPARALPPEPLDYDGLAAADDDNSREVLADSVAPVLDAGLVDWVDSSPRDHRRGPPRADARSSPTTARRPRQRSHPLGGRRGGRSPAT